MFAKRALDEAPFFSAEKLFYGINVAYFSVGQVDGVVLNFK